MSKQPKQSLYEAFSKQLKPQVSTTLSTLKPVMNDRPATSKPLQNLSNAPIRTQEDVGKRTQARSPQRKFENPPLENKSCMIELDERPIPKVLQKGKSPQPSQVAPKQNEGIRIQDQRQFDDRPLPTAKPSLDGQLQINQNRQFQKPKQGSTPQQSQSQQCFKAQQNIVNQPVNEQRQPYQQQQTQQSKQQREQQLIQQEKQQQQQQEKLIQQQQQQLRQQQIQLQQQQQQQQQQLLQQQQLQQQQSQQTRLSLQSNQTQKQQQSQRPQTQQSQTQLKQPQSQFNNQREQHEQPQQLKSQQSTRQIPQQQQQKQSDPIKQDIRQPPQQFAPMAQQPKMMPEEQEDTRLFECPEGCGRSFNAKALEKHAKVCQKVFQQKRKVFDSHQQRLMDEEEAYKAAPPPPTKKQQQQQKKQQPQKEKKGDQPKWKAQSEAFRAIIKQGKGQQLTAQEQAQLKSAMDASSDLVQCKFCNRKFNPETAKKHIAFCESKAKQAVTQKKKK